MDNNGNGAQRPTLIRPTVKSTFISVGDFSYFEGEDFERHVTRHREDGAQRLVIGRFCRIGRDVEFVMSDADRPLGMPTTFPFDIIEGLDVQVPGTGKDRDRGDTVIGNDVRIGEGTTILPGVHIGDGAVIGRNSTVGSDIPPYAVAAGNPATVTRFRFDEDLISLLGELRWWDKEINEIKPLLPLLTSTDLEDVRSRLRIMLGRPLEFKATILQSEGMDAAYVKVPFDIPALFGKGRLMVSATFDSVPYEGQIVRMGTPEHILGIPKAIRAKIGKTFGDSVTVSFRPKDGQASTSPSIPRHDIRNSPKTPGDGETLEVRFHDRVEDDSQLRFAVIIAKTLDGKWILCRHRDRTTLEFPGGHREPGESIMDTAKRELREETGARAYTINPLCVYSVKGSNSVNEGGEETFGMLYRAAIASMGKTDSEIEEVLLLDDLPDNWTYPEIQPVLLAKYRELTQQ